MNTKELLELVASAKRRKLSKLDLSEQSISELPPEIGELTSLVELKVSDNRFARLPKEIGNLVNLKVLDISRNRLSRLPKEIGLLKQLVELSLDNNDLVSLPIEIGELTDLRELRLSGNQLKSLPKQIGNLERLEIITLTADKLRSLPAEIGNLKKLRILQCYGNLLTELPKEIGELTALETLYLSGNPLTSIPVEISLLRNLRILHLKHNKLKELPQEIVELDNLQEIRLDGNPLRFPPIQIATQGFEAIKEYISSIQKDEFGRRVLFEAKLMIVGQAGVGKTSLLNRLLYDFFDEREQPTKGVDIETWDREMADAGIDIREWDLPILDEGGRIIRLNVWDFGGQEIYHATHQFFLTKDSVYLLVWDSRGDESAQVYEWLYKLESLAEDSPIILVLNKCDMGIRDINLRDLRERFPQIRGLYQVSCKDPEKGKHSFELLTDEITRLALELLKEGAVWSKSWLDVRRAIAADNRNYMAYSEYLALCKQHDVEGKEARVLSGYLHELGVTLHFQDVLGLRYVMILKPEWVTDAVHKVLGAQLVRDRGGVLQHRELGNVWEPDRYPEVVYPTLLDLLNRFELAYELPDGESHLVAELLPVTEPEIDWLDRDSLRFFYQYDFLPASVMTRFIVLAHHDLEESGDGKHLCWREGAVLHWEKTRVLVRVRKMEKLIEIRIAGLKKRELLAIVRHHLDHINRSLRKARITQQIPCNCFPGCENRFDYEGLLEAERKGRTTVECQRQWVDMPLSLLLDGYERKQDRMEYRLYKEEIVKEEKVIRIGDKATISAPIVIADTIQDSFNTLMESTVDDDVKALLDQLLREVNEANKKVPQDKADEAETMARDAETLVKEATSSKPRRRWYEVTLDGLKQAAINIGAIAIPVLDIVSKLRPLLLP